MNMPGMVPLFIQEINQNGEERGNQWPNALMGSNKDQKKQ